MSTNEAESKAYLFQNKIDLMMDQLISRLVEAKPADPAAFLKAELDDWAPPQDPDEERPPVPSGDGDIAIIGLAVMGMNLILNFNDHGFKVVAHNRSVDKVEAFMNGEAKGTNVVGAKSIPEMVGALRKPRKVMLLVRAGSAVDEFIAKLTPHLEPGDIIIDGGNSHFPDTIRRTKALEKRGFLYIGTGVSGGEEGARVGPSLMPGGSAEAWPHVKEMFQAVSAKVEGTTEPCCDWVGPDGSGHYVKMVHNGIEYGDMQLICEAYHLMKDLLKLDCATIGKHFDEFNQGDLASYLIEITAAILKYNDADGVPMVEKIRDTAGQKGTGKWTGIESMDQGVPLTLIGESVYARCLSAQKDLRVNASKHFSSPECEVPPAEPLIADIKEALYCAKIISYAQGYMLLREAAKAHKWTLNYGGVALMWRGGCIIRSVFLGEIKKAFDEQPDLENLLLAPFFKDAIKRGEAAWRRVVSFGAQAGIPIPCMSAALSFYDGFRTEILPANLLQAQRDYFGAHTYELLDKPGTWHHTNWTGTGGDVASSTYNV